MQKQTFKINLTLPFVYTRYVHGQPDPRTDEQGKERAKERTHSNGQGLFIPNQMIKAAIVSAASRSGFKFKGFKTGQSVNMLRMSIYVEPEEIPLTRNGKQLRKTNLRVFPIDMRLKRGDMKRLWYACIDPPSEAEFSVNFLEDMEPRALKELIDFAGLWCRIGGLRTHNYGMFEIVV